MIQDIFPHHYDNRYLDMKPQDTDMALICSGRGILLTFQEGEITLPKVSDVDAAQRSRLRYLFSVDEKPCFGTTALQGEVLPEGFLMTDVRELRTARPKYLAFTAVTAVQLLDWYDSRTFCGRCGSRMQDSDKERMRVCPECGQMEYPKLSPAVIIAVTHGDRLLLSKYAGRVYKNYALLAGFCEIGETVEETVRREVMEEVGLKVKNIRYYKSQPWSFTDTLLMGFYCDLDSDDEDVTLDQEELAMAAWYSREEIPVRPEDCSLTNEMIIHFKTKNESRNYIPDSFFVFGGSVCDL